MSIRNVILATASLAAVSCAPDRTFPAPMKPTSDEVNIRFRMSLPSPGPMATRAADDGEFAVNNISLLVFVQEGGTGDFTYRYTAVGRRLDQPNNTAVDFEALFVDNPDPVRLLAVANHAEGFLNAIEEGTTEAGIRSELVSNSSDFSQGIPMTGVAELTSLSDATGIVQIPLVRSVAKTTVTVIPDGSSPDFTITSVEVWRIPEYWQFLPGVGCVENETTAPVPLTPSVQFTEDVVNMELNNVGDSQLWSGYVFEAAIPSGLDEGIDPATRAACIIVGGKYADDQTDTYYRINFGRLGDSANPLGQVLRNYWYEFTIVGVDGSGWESAQDAAANPAAGLRTTAVPWNGGGNTDYYFGHNDYIKLSADNMELDAQIDHTATMTITTSDVSFTATSVHYPGAGMLDTSDPGQVLETDIMRFEMTSLPAGPGEQIWQLTVTALTAESITDYLQLHAADGLLTISIFIQRNPPPGHDPPPGDDPAKRRIRVLMLGSNTYGSLNRQTNYGVPAMLRNTGYFGPTGAVVCAGMDILPITMSESNAENNVAMVNAALEGADIIVTTWNYHPSEEVSHAIYEWISVENSGRVAFITCDAPGIAPPLRAYLDGTIVWNSVGYLGSDTATYSGYGTGYTGTRLPPQSASDDDPGAPFLDGVFGNAWSCDNLRATPYDGTSMYMNIANANYPIVPLMITTGSSGPNTDVIIVGVDTRRHIVWSGDATLIHTEGIGGTAANTSLAYDPANYINVMWSNTWAWAIDKVITENYDVPEALVE